MKQQFLAERKTPIEINPDRDAFSRDKARVIHSFSFRRLQNKKQVFDSHESDFSRNRLTHTLEVAQISVGIIHQIKRKFMGHQIVTALPSEACAEAIALCHDLGHPPNGHEGESVLNYLMYARGGFESNAQSLRIISNSDKYEKGSGLNLTRATMLGTVKYPVPYRKVCKLSPSLEQYKKMKDKSANYIKYKDWIPPKCIFKEEEKILDWIMAPFSKEDKDLYLDYEKPSKKEHGKAKFKNLLCSIMDLADDIAYGTHDLEDAQVLGIIDKKTWEEQTIERIKKHKIDKEMRGIFSWDDFSKSLFLENFDRKRAISQIIDLFITNLVIETKEEFQDPVLRYKIELPSTLKMILQIIKDFTYEYVVEKRERQMLEFKMQKIIADVFECLASDPKRFFLSDEEADIPEDNLLRLVCDYVSGMTDNYLIKIYHRLFTPGFGSIFDKI